MANKQPDGGKKLHTEDPGKSTQHQNLTEEKGRRPQDQPGGGKPGLDRARDDNQKDHSGKE